MRSTSVEDRRNVVDELRPLLLDLRLARATPWISTSSGRGEGIGSSRWFFSPAARSVVVTADCRTHRWSYRCGWLASSRIGRRNFAAGCLDARTARPPRRLPRHWDANGPRNKVRPTRATRSRDIGRSGVDHSCAAGDGRQCDHADPDRPITFGRRAVSATRSGGGNPFHRVLCDVRAGRASGAVRHV